MDIQKARVQLMAFIAGLIILSMTAEKCRELVGEEASSKSGKFTWINCFDMSSGTLACMAKEGAKLYVYNLRAGHVERARQRAMEIALNEALSEGLSTNAATKQAQKAGAKAAKLASRQTKRITGPILAAGWDFFEALYYQGSITEGCMRGVGTLFGAYAGGFKGEQKFGRLGYLIGSHLGNWLGGRVGLMVYDVINGVQHLMHAASSFASDTFSSEDTHESSEKTYESPEALEDAYRSENQYKNPETYTDDVLEL